MAEPRPPATSWRPRRIHLLVALALALSLATGVSIGVLISTPDTPSDSSADAGFARDMQTHHAQAVEMSMIAYQRSTDPEIRTIAYDIALTQQSQSGILHDWLDQWQLPATSTATPMSWMAGDPASGGMTMTVSTDGLMPGMATKNQLAKLRAATGRDLDILYSQLTIRHHLGGIMMIDGVLKRSQRPEVLTLAGAMKNGQQNEIAIFKTILTRYGAAPL
jgi:uncharacterized protein (DUF305 family)